MQRGASVRGDPAHPLLVKIPIAFYAAGYFGLVAFAAGGAAFWYRASYLALLCGVAVALAAAVFGMIDLARVPRELAARRRGTLHGGLNTGSLLLFAITALAMRSEWRLHGPDGALAYTVPLVFGSCAVVLMALAAMLGLELVTRDQVGRAPVPTRPGRIPLDDRKRATVPLAAADVVTVIHEQHDRIDGLLQSLRGAPAAARRDLSAEVCNHIEAHAEMEEALFYAVFELPGGKQLTTYAEDHREIREMLARLDIAQDETRFGDDVAYIAAAIAAHQAQEERELLPRLAAALHDSEREVLGSEMLALHAQLLARGVQHGVARDAAHAARV